MSKHERKIMKLSFIIFSCLCLALICFISPAAVEKTGSGTKQAVEKVTDITAPEVIKPEVPKTELKLFRQTEINNIGNIVGRYPLSENEAKKARHRELYYEGEKLIKLTSRDAYGNLESTTEYRYDANGRTTESRSIGADGKLIGVYKYSSNSKGQYTGIKYFGVNDKLQSDFGGIAIWRYQYDDKGKQIRTDLCDENEKLLGTKTVKYDEKGNKVELEFVDEILKTLKGIAISRYKYDPLGNTVEEALLEGNGTLTYRFEYEHDKKGYRTGMKTRGAGGKLISRNKYSYDDRGNKAMEKVYGSDGKLESTGKSEYDAKGNLVEEATYGPDNKLIKPGVAVVRFEYNDRGQMIKEAGYDADGKLIEDTSGVALFKYKYDAQGNVVEEGFYSKDEKPIKEGIAFNRYKYDKSNRLTEESYHNAGGKFVIDLDGVAVRRYKYDKSGEISSLEEFDAAMKPVEN